MKKTLALVLAVVMVALMIPFSAAAAGNRLTLAVESKTFDLQEGATVEVPIAATENMGYASGTFYVSWDATNLELTEITYSDLAPACTPAPISNEGTYKINFGEEAGTGNFEGTGIFFILKFKILEGASAGTYDIDLSEPEVFDFDINAVDTTLTSGTVTLKGEEVHVHSMTKFDEKSATCTENGNSEYYYCAECGKYFNDAEGKAETTAEAVIITAKGHTPGEAVKENSVEAACEKDGSYDEVKYCTVCNEEISRTTVTVPATGHDWGEWVVTKPATENEDGEKIRTCKNDPSHIETASIPKLTHVHKLTVVEGFSATCTSEGKKTYYVCDECGKMFEDATMSKEITSEAELIIPKSEHTPSDWIIDSEATETEPGTKHKECTVCGKTLETEVIPVIEPTTEPVTTEPVPTEPVPTEPVTVEPTTSAPSATQPSTNGASTADVVVTPSGNGTVQTGESSTAFIAFITIVLCLAAAYSIHYYKKRKE